MVRNNAGLDRPNFLLYGVWAAHAGNWLSDLEWISASRFHGDLLPHEALLEVRHVPRACVVVVIRAAWADVSLIKSFLLHVKDIWLNKVLIRISRVDAVRNFMRLYGSKLFICVYLIWVELLDFVSAFLLSLIVGLEDKALRVKFLVLYFFFLIKLQLLDEVLMACWDFARWGRLLKGLELVQVFEADHDNCNVVKRSPGSWGFKKELDTLADHLMYGLLRIRVNGVPADLDTLWVIQFFKDPIASQDDVIAAWVNFDHLDLWLCNHYVGVTSVFHKLSFNVSKSPAHGKPAWEDSKRS